MRTISLVIFLLSLALICCAVEADPSSPLVARVVGDDGLVLTSSADIVAADAGVGDAACPVNGCCYPPSWPSNQGACSCVDATGKGCLWDETCPVGLHCSTLHPVLKADAGLPACGNCK